MKKGQISFATMITYVLALIIYVVGFYPVISKTIADAGITDPLTNSIITLVPPAFFIAMIIGMFNYALGRRPAGAWGGA